MLQAVSQTGDYDNGEVDSMLIRTSNKLRGQATVSTSIERLASCCLIPKAGLNLREQTQFLFTTNDFVQNDCQPIQAPYQKKQDSLHPFVLKVSS